MFSTRVYVSPPPRASLPLRSPLGQPRPVSLSQSLQPAQDPPPPTTTTAPTFPSINSKQRDFRPNSPTWAGELRIIIINKVQLAASTIC